MDTPIPQNYMRYAMARESAGDPNAKSGTSSASGLFGFTNGTADAVRANHPELNLTPGWQNDVGQASTGMQAFTQDNANTLSAAGAPVNSTTLYLAHHFGANGALKALAADVSAPASSVFGPAVMKANPDLSNKRIGDLTGYSPQMADPQQQQTPLAQAMQQPQGTSASTLFGGNPTPIGGLGALARMLGIGSETEFGRRLQNAGAALISINNPAGGAALQDAANQPHFNVVSDPYGNRFAIDTRTGRPISMAGGANTQTQGQPQPSQAQGQPSQAQGQPPLSDYDGLLGPTMINAAHESSQKRMDAMDQAAASAQGVIDLNKQALRLSQDPSTQGAQGPGLMTMIRDKIADLTGGSVTFGGGIDINKVHDLDKINSRLVQANLKDMPGIRTALPEIKFGQQANADLEKPALTSQQIYSNNIQDAQRVLDARNIARQHMANGGVLGPAFSKHLEDYQAAHPVAQDATVKTSSPSEIAPGFKVLKVY